MSVLLDPQGTIELGATLSARTDVIPRWREYLVLIKPRIAVMGLVTVALGFLLAATGEWSAITLGLSLLGIGLIAASCSALNQWLHDKSKGDVRGVEADAWKWIGRNSDAKALGSHLGVEAPFAGR